MKITNDSIRKIADAACRLPGPIWLFGAYILYNFATWSGNLLVQLLDRTPGSSGYWNWTNAAIQVKLLGYEVYMLFILYGLLRRKRYAVPLVAWVAGIQFIIKVIGTVSVIRMEYAKQHLLSGNESIERIAARVGLPSGKVLTKLFHEQEGMSPAKYRALHQHK